MSSQNVETIAVADLVLWTENPRDKIRSNAKDQDVVNRAVSDPSGKWTLRSLAREMGDYYDFSELPTVVYKNKKPVVYDGNRRMILAKLRHGLVSYPGSSRISLPDIPSEIPCNVCSEDIALKNILRKHADSGSWSQLDRDVFVSRFMGEPKSDFLLLEEATGLISSRPKLNQGFVKDEVFSRENLAKMGFEIKNGMIQTPYSNAQATRILNDAAKKVEDKEITTRKNRYNLLGVLNPDTQTLITQNKRKPSHRLKFHIGVPSASGRRTPRTRQKPLELFGAKLLLRSGLVSDCERDITDLYAYYQKEKTRLSASFPALIRMSLRLICECAAKDSGLELKRYLKKHFASAKATLNKDQTTTLSTHNVDENSIDKLLHVGAHSYQAAQNLEQTLAVSLIVGAMLTISHGK